MTLRFSTIARSEVGLVRDGNEDSALVSNCVIAVADGMGGHAGGEVASAIAITTLAGLVEVLEDSAIDPQSREDLLMNISFSIDTEIENEVKKNPNLTGMGTTLTALHLGEESVELLHIGDSRCYQWDGKKLKQLSYDHTVMQELIDQGRLTLDEVANHPQRSMLTQALMGDGQIDPVLTVFPTKVGYRYLLCSDGLTNVISDHEMAQLLKRNSGSEIIDALMDAVHAKGAPDNITIFLAEVVDDGQSVDRMLLGAAKVE